MKCVKIEKAKKIVEETPKPSVELWVTKLDKKLIIYIKSKVESESPSLSARSMLLPS